MGNADTKLHFRKAVLQLTTKTQVRHFNLMLNFYLCKEMFIIGLLSRLLIEKCVSFIFEYIKIKPAVRHAPQI